MQNSTAQCSISSPIFRVVKQYFLLFVVALAVLCTDACRPAANTPAPAPPANLIAEDTLIQILADIHLLEAAYKDHKNAAQLPYSKEQMYAWVMQHHPSVKIEDFKNSFIYYSSQADKMERIYDRVMEELSRREAKND